jgi:hypothetical protein
MSKIIFIFWMIAMILGLVFNIFFYEMRRIMREENAKPNTISVFSLKPFKPFLQNTDLKYNATSKCYCIYKIALCIKRISITIIILVIVAIIIISNR